MLSAHAQQVAPVASDAATAPPKAAAPKMQQVEVKGSAETYDARRDDTASKIVVNHEEIVKYGDTNVVDVLKRLPGITVSGASGRGGGEIRMRGLGAGYTQILLNGERAPAGFSLDSLSPDVIERIEVLRAASAEFSTQSIAGTINIILKKAIKNAQRELKLGAGGGRGLVNPNANLQLSDKLGAMSYSLSANAFYQKFNRESPTVEEGFDPAGRQVLLRHSATNERGQFSAVNLAPRLNWTLANGDTVTSQTFVNVNRFSRSAGTDVVTSVGTAPQYPAIASVMSNANEFFRTDLNWVHKFASEAKLDLKIGGLVGGLGNEQRRLGYNQAGALTLDSAIHSKGTDHGGTATGKFSTPMFDGHALSLGWDGGINSRDDARVQVDVPLPGALPANSDERYFARVSRLAAFAQDEWNVTPRWSVYLGARWEGIRTSTSGNSFATADSRTSVWSPLFQTLYKLPGTKADQLRFAVTRTYKAPNTQSLIPRRFSSVNNSSTEPDFQGNPNLKPELALGLDGSFEHYWGEGALLSASASMRRIDGYTRNGLFFDDGRWVSRPVNDGQAHTRGIELEAKFPLKSLFADAAALDLRASASRNWSSVDAVQGPDNRLDAQTPFSATLGVDYKVGALTTGGSFAFKNGGPVRISTTQSSFQSVRRDLEVYGLWKFDPRNQLRVALSNILGQDYVAQNTYADAYGAVHRTSIYPGTVVARATMEMKF
ncbi:MAG: TonB-dependent receptor [Pseudomonadota bacterium]|nr:TonB-dependent receptor [Pseudomonadota bacterium]